MFFGLEEVVYGFGRFQRWMRVGFDRSDRERGGDGGGFVFQPCPCLVLSIQAQTSNAKLFATGPVGRRSNTCSARRRRSAEKRTASRRVVHRRSVQAHGRVDSLPIFAQGATWWCCIHLVTLSVCCRSGRRRESNSVGSIRLLIADLKHFDALYRLSLLMRRFGSGPPPTPGG